MKKILPLLLVLSACVQPVKKPEQPEVPNTVELSWGKPDWTKKTFEIVDQNLEVFSKAKDMKTFCPKFSELSLNQKRKTIGEFIVSVVKHESGFNTNSVYMEPAPLFYNSVGLLQLSYEDQKGYPFCKLDRASKNLQDPINNLDCGLKIMAKLIGKWGAISTSDNKGAAAYWSVLRPIKSGKPRPSYHGIIKHVQSKVPACL